MLKIRPEQMLHLAEASRRNFEDRMVVYLREFYPQEFEEHRVRTCIRNGVERARTYGIRTEQEVAGFVSLTFEYGEGFDTDPTYLYATESLRDASLDERDKMSEVGTLLEDSSEADESEDEEDAP